VSPFAGQELVAQFRWVGADLYRAGAVSSHEGNLSVRLGDTIVITRSGSMLGRLTAEDLIEVGVETDGRDESLASTELVVHREIYRRTPATAVVHVHPRHTVFRSLVDDVISPLDSETDFHVGAVPVVALPSTIGSPDVADAVAESLSSHRIVVVRGHGPFAAGETLEHAFGWVSVVEASCAILDLRDATGLTVKEWRPGADKGSET
jgi:L-fuculose-phosphate aldolase